MEVSEECDDGNSSAFDGCSDRCQKEDIVSTVILPPEPQSCSLYEQLSASLDTESLKQQKGLLQITIGDHSFVYTDVPVISWYARSLTSLSSSHIISGTEATVDASLELSNTTESRLFKPGDHLTFGELAKMASIAASLPKSAFLPTSPLAQNHWAQEYMAQLERVLQGFFPVIDPDQEVTRGDFIATIVKAFDIPVENTYKNLYQDMYATHRYYNEIYAATAVGIVYGDTDARGNFLFTIRPNEKINRAEAVSILDRALRIMCRLEGAFPILPASGVASMQQSRNATILQSTLEDTATGSLHASAPVEHEPTQEEQDQALSLLVCSVYQNRSDTVLAAHEDVLKIILNNEAIVYNDVPWNSWYALYLSVLTDAEILSGYVGEQRTLIDSSSLTDADVLLLHSSAGGPSMLGVSNADTEIKAQREAILQKLVKLQASNALLFVRPFKPEKHLTLGEMAKMISRAAGLTPSTVPVHNPSAALHWSAPFVSRLEEEKLTDFFGVVTDIDREVTRGTFIQAIVEAFDFDIEQGLTPTYIDLYADHRNADAIMTATKLGIVTGDVDTHKLPLNTVRPSALITRSEAAALLYRAMKVECGPAGSAPIVNEESQSIQQTPLPEFPEDALQFQAVEPFDPLLIEELGPGFTEEEYEEEPEMPLE